MFEYWTVVKAVACLFYAISGGTILQFSAKKSTLVLPPLMTDLWIFSSRVYHFVCEAALGTVFANF